MILAETGSVIATSVLVAILIAAGFFALRSSLKHMMGRGGCCGGGEDDGPAVPKKKLGEIVAEKSLVIDGMRCEGCSAAVEDALNRLEHVNADVDLKRKTAIVRMDAVVSDSVLTQTVVRAGYSVRCIK